MSYDIAVYTRESCDVPRRADLIRSIPDLEADEDDGRVRARHDGRYAFDVAGPEPVEAEDVPPGLAELHAGTRWVHVVVVQGSSAAGIARAVRFARALATAADGAVYDRNDGIWLDGTTHRPPVAPDRRVDVVAVHWYARRADRPADLAARWLDLCRRHLPAALPRRYGPGEPPVHRFDRDEDFATVVDAEDVVFFAGTPPCLAGALAGGVPARPGPVEAHTLTVDRAAADGLVELFVAMAEAAGCVYASAAVERGLSWTGRTLYHDAGAERSGYLAGGGEFVGLPPEPVAWSWFGPPYARLVGRDLPGCEPTATGLLHRWAEVPPDRDGIVAPVPWTRPDLLARRDAAGRPVPAARIPRPLRRSLWSRLGR